MEILEFASQLPDKRIERKKLHSSKNSVFITITTVICGVQNWENIEEFGYCKEDFFRDILELPHGIPSHDTFNRFFATLSPGKTTFSIVDTNIVILGLLQIQVIYLLLQIVLVFVFSGGEKIGNTDLIYTFFRKTLQPENNKCIYTLAKKNTPLLIIQRSK